MFSFFWAIAHFVDEFRQPVALVNDPIGGLLHIGVFALAISLLFKPSSTKRLFALSLSSIAVTFTQLPITPNHNMIFLMGDLAVVSGIVVYSFRQNANMKDWFRDTEPFLRIALLVTYGSATLAKLNSGWFNSELSCSVVMPQREYDWLPFEIPWNEFWFMPWLVGGSEALIWLLPLISKIRPYALVLAVSFHTLLSLTPDSQGLGFSFLLFSLLMLYLPNDSHVELHGQGKKILRRITDAKILGPVVYGFILISILMGFISFVDFGNAIFMFVRYAPMLVLLIIFALLIAYQALKHRKAEAIRPAVAVRHWTQLVLLILILLNSLGPYFGYKTYATMTMYSNLSVGNGQTNHLFIPKLPISGMADDIVEVVETSNGKLQSYMKRDLKITWHELRRILAENPTDSITYIRNGERFALTNASENPELVSIDPILHRFLGFRPIGEENVCLW